MGLFLLLIFTSREIYIFKELFPYRSFTLKKKRDILCLRLNMTSYEYKSLPIKIGETRRVPKPLSEGIRIDFQFGDELILIGRNCRENSLGKYEGSILLLFQVGDGSGMLPPFYQVYAGLVSMHRIQNDLKQGIN